MAASSKDSFAQKNDKQRMCCGCTCAVAHPLHGIVNELRTSSSAKRFNAMQPEKGQPPWRTRQRFNLLRPHATVYKQTPPLTHLQCNQVLLQFNPVSSQEVTNNEINARRSMKADAYDAKMPTRRHDPQQRANIVLGKMYFQKVLELWITNTK